MPLGAKTLPRKPSTTEGRTDPPGVDRKNPRDATAELSRRFPGMKDEIPWTPIPRHFTRYLRRALGFTATQREIVEGAMHRLPWAGGHTKVVVSDDALAIEIGTNAGAVKDAVWPSPRKTTKKKKRDYASENARHFRDWVPIVRGKTREKGKEAEATEFDLAYVFSDFPEWLADEMPELWRTMPAKPKKVGPVYMRHKETAAPQKSKAVAKRKPAPAATPTQPAAPAAPPMTRKPKSVFGRLVLPPPETPEELVESMRRSATRMRAGLNERP